MFSSVLIGIAITAIMSFWGWLAVKVIGQGQKLVELEQQVSAQANRCTERLGWIRNMEGKLDKVAEDTSAIRVALGEPPHA